VSAVRQLAAAAATALVLASPTGAREPVAAVALVDDLFTGETQDPYRLALRAYVWGYPLVRAAQNRQNVTLPADPSRVRPRTAAGAPINRIGHAQELSTPETRLGVAPNNDTLYSLAWLDLNDGPFVFETPDFGARYYVFQMGQADSSTDRANARLDTAGHVLDGRNSYELRFDKDHLPPVDAFWSVTMSYAKGFMVPNPIARYAIGDRTPGLRRDPDGGIRILIQHARPVDPKAVNWLPRPPNRSC
jgi:hypothetical protein